MTPITNNKSDKALYFLFLSHFLFFSFSHSFLSLIASNLIVLVVVGSRNIIYFKSEALQWQYKIVVKLSGFGVWLLLLSL